MTRCFSCDEIILPYGKTNEGHVVHVCACTSYWPKGYSKDVKLKDLKKLDF